MSIRRRNYSSLYTIKDKKQLFLTVQHLLKNDLFFLCRYGLNYKDMETHTSIHYGLCDRLESPDFNRLAVMMFRGSLKTSILIAWALQEIIKNPDKQFGFGSETEDRAKERFSQVKLILETNKLFYYFFPKVFYKEPRSESPRWNEYEMYCKLPSDSVGGFRLPTFSLFGLDPLPVGSHYDIAWLDDVEHEANTTTADTVAKLTSRMSGFMPTLKTGAKVVLTGTYYHPSGPNVFYSNRWPLYRIPILDKYGNPTFPNLKPLKECHRIQREDVDEWGWQTQFMLNVQLRMDEYAYPFKNKLLQPAYIVQGRYDQYHELLNTY